MKWLTSIAFLAFCAWIMFTFQGCGLKKKPRCHNAWEMPDGAVCRYQAVYSCATYVFSQCANGREYLDPVWWTPKEVCDD